MALLVRVGRSVNVNGHVDGDDSSDAGSDADSMFVCCPIMTEDELYRSCCKFAAGITKEHFLDKVHEELVLVLGVNGSTDFALTLDWAAGFNVLYDAIKQLASSFFTNWSPGDWVSSPDFWKIHKGDPAFVAGLPGRIEAVLSTNHAHNDRNATIMQFLRVNCQRLVELKQKYPERIKNYIDSPRAAQKVLDAVADLEDILEVKKNHAV